VGEDGSELDQTIPAFVELFMQKVKRLEKTRFEKGKSVCPEMQWEKGKSACPEMQWEKGENACPEMQWEKGESDCPEKQWQKGKSGCPEKQCQKGERGSKATQWGSPWGTGSFGVKGSQQTYDSMTALAKAIGKHQSGMSRAWRAAMETAPSSELRVFFRYAGLELVFYKEVDSGKN
jgi:hypothetical protein